MTHSLASYKSSEEVLDDPSSSSFSLVPYVKGTGFSGSIGSVSETCLASVSAILPSESQVPRYFKTRRIIKIMNPEGQKKKNIRE